MLNASQWKVFAAETKSANYYWGEDAVKSGAQYCVELGGRDIGKSYFFRQYAIRDALLNNNLLGYIRRYGVDAKPAAVANYFSGVQWANITDGRFNTVVCQSGAIYAAYRDDHFKITDKQLIGYYYALALAEHYKSMDFPNVVNLIFEEFIASNYIPDESNALQNLISTIVRDNSAQCFLIGNILTRACPYFSEWSLTHTPRMRAGDVDIYHIGDNGTIVRVEMCCESVRIKKKSASLFFGKSSKMIAENQWHSEIFDKCPVNPYRDAEKQYEIVIRGMNITQSMALYIDRENHYPFVFVTPHDGFTFRDVENVRLITDGYISLNPLHQRHFRPLNDAEKIIADCILQGRIFFCDNLTGTDFTTIWKNLI